MIKVLSIPQEPGSQIILLHHKHPQHTLELIFIYQKTKTTTKKQNQAFLALVAATRPQIHFPSSYKCSRACLATVQDPVFRLALGFQSKAFL